ncbi:hypothetical protein H2C68_07510 [Vibrio alginolyticus]|uniref:hypothetical protein n=1 Tax=Vibrio alginolyticus TaxID=663 RepID=UPI0006CF6AE5|nr:hypothetical protein [Vibrio alginolyticus]MBS9978269.1 hypothetical protein [Vibrio alginolyticus]MCQ9036828.1 hypothetical protein [Vibrio alginolyticus]
MDSFTRVYLKAARSVYLNKRVLTVIGFLNGFIATLILFSGRFSDSLSRVLNFELEGTVVPLIFGGISLFSFALLYLQSGRGNDIGEGNEALQFRIDRELISQRQALESHYIEIKNLKSQLESLNSDEGFSEDEKSQIIADAVSQMSESSIKRIFNTEALQFKQELAQNLGYEKLKRSIDEVKYRIQREISDLRLRANVNLLIGMLITAGGLYLLWTTVSMVDASKLLKELASEGSESNGKFLKNLILPLIPRVMLVVFVEVFAYFFLRLYKEGLAEIKYFQNELTNIESKLVALEFSFVTKNHDAMTDVITSLASTERNFVLNKNQTTVELEKAKSETQMTQTLIKALPNLFKKK